MHTEIGKWIITIGVLIVFGGILVYLFGDKLGWLGSLPGDIHIQKEHFSFYFPVTTMIIISIVLSIVVTLIARFFRG